MSVFTRYPTNLFTRERWFYPVYDATWFILLLGFLGALELTGFRGFIPEWRDFRVEYLLLLPLFTYGLILCNVFAHNASHRNFPRVINRLVGEIVGCFVLTRFASWEIIHLRHHKYSDDPERDPHNCLPGFWTKFLPYFVRNVERQLQEHFYDYHGGRTSENLHFQKWRALLSFATGVLLAVAFLRVLGAPLFFAVFIPAQIISIVQLAHFNWSTHDGGSTTGNYRPINIDRGLYWLGNRIFFGIYYHDNHHRIVTAFNPMFVEARSDNAHPGGPATASESAPFEPSVRGLHS